MGILFSIIMWTVLSIAVASVAKSKFDRNYTGWLLVSFFTSPLIGIVALLLAGTNGKKCPECAETIKLDAKVCKHCGYKFQDDRRQRLDLVDKILAEKTEKHQTNIELNKEEK